MTIVRRYPLNARLKPEKRSQLEIFDLLNFLHLFSLPKHHPPIFFAKDLCVASASEHASPAAKGKFVNLLLMPQASVTS